VALQDEALRREKPSRRLIGRPTMGHGPRSSFPVPIVRTHTIGTQSIDPFFQPIAGFTTSHSIPPKPTAQWPSCADWLVSGLASHDSIRQLQWDGPIVRDPAVASNTSLYGPGGNTGIMRALHIRTVVPEAPCLSTFSSPSLCPCSFLVGRTHQDLGPRGSPLRVGAATQLPPSLLVFTGRGPS